MPGTSSPTGAYTRTRLRAGVMRGVHRLGHAVQQLHLVAVVGDAHRRAPVITRARCERKLWVPNAGRPAPWWSCSSSLHRS